MDPPGAPPNPDLRHSDDDDDASSSSSGVSNGHEDAAAAAAAAAADSEALRDLDAEETDKLVQLRDMIGLDDVAVCRALLESKGWDLEATAREQLGLGDPAQEREELRRRREEQRPVQAPQQAPDLRVVRQGGAGAARAGASGREAEGGSFLGGLFNWGMYLFTLPVTLPFRVIQTMYGVLRHLLGTPGGALEGPPPTRNNQNGSGAPLNPLEDVRRFAEDFNRDYVAEGGRRPDFKVLTYAQALEEAKKDLRFLLVYLHCPDHEDVPSFCRDTLASEQVLDFLEGSNMLLWGCSVESGEGHRVSQAMREATYPFLAVIVLRQSRMMMVGRVEGGRWGARPEQLVRRLEEIVRDNEAYVVAARMDREERVRTQSIRAEQDAAFQETLRQDQEKERRKREEEEAKRRQEEEEQRIVREEQERRDRIRRLKVDLADRVPEEPSQDHPDTLRILIKLPGGQRLERRFLRTQPVRDLYFFVFCHPESPDEFDIATNFPKRVLKFKPSEICFGEGEESEGESASASFQDAGIGQSTMLFVHDLEA